MTEQPDDDREPRLQDTTERSALPLPLPEDDEAPPEAAAAADEPAPAEPAADAPPADKSPAVDEPAASADGPAPGGPPPFDPFVPADEGTRPEVLVGAAFAGGLALALLIRRLAR